MVRWFFIALAHYNEWRTGRLSGGRKPAHSGFDPPAKTRHFPVKFTRLNPAGGIVRLFNKTVSGAEGLVPGAPRIKKQKAP